MNARKTRPAGPADRSVVRPGAWAWTAARWRTLGRGGAVTVAALIAAVSCLSALGRQPLSWDEAVTLSAARHSPGRLLALLAHTDAPLGFYYGAMHGWVRLGALLGLPMTETWLRLPSALAGIGAVVLLVRLAADRYGPQAALIAGTALAVHPLFVFYAHDARPYTLATFLAIAATGLFLRARRRPTIKTLSAYAVVATATVYMHLFAATVLALHAAVIALRGPRRIAWALAAAAAATVPLVLLGRGQTGEIAWIPAPSAASVASVLLKVGGGIVPVLALLLIGAQFRGRRPAARTVFALSWALLPPLLLVAADFVTPVLVARYALVAVPGVALALAVAWHATSPEAGIGAGLAAGWRGRRRFVVAGLAVLLAGGVVTSVVQQARPFKYEDYRAAADLVADTARRGDAVLYVPEATRVGITTYDQVKPGEQRVTDVALQPGGSPASADRIAGVEIPAAEVPARLAGRPDVYLIGSALPGALANPAERVKLAALTRDYAVVWSRHFGGLFVTLLTRRNATRPTGASTDF